MNKAIILEFVADVDRPNNLLLKNQNETSFYWFHYNEGWQKKTYSGVAIEAKKYGEIKRGKLCRNIRIPHLNYVLESKAKINYLK